jgi:formate dehydrogenase major subunit
MAPICGIDAKTHPRGRAALRHFAGASMHLWGMGISQHVHGTDNARCLIALALCTGQIAKPGSGLHPCAGRTTCRARPTPG